MTKNMAPGDSVYGEKRITVEGVSEKLGEREGEREGGRGRGRGGRDGRTDREAVDGECTLCPTNLPIFRRYTKMRKLEVSILYNSLTQRSGKGQEFSISWSGGNWSINFHLCHT